MLMTPTLAYTEMQLKPVSVKNKSFNSMQVGRTYNYHKGSRILAAKEASFPILDQYEALLFPQKDFSKDKAKARLERIEIAVHGNVQIGSIKHRLNLLENEITAWQIANYQTLEILKTKKKNPNAFQYAQVSNPSYSRAQHTQPNPYQARPISIRQNTSMDYDRENYRLVSPIVRDLGRRSVRALFDL